MIWCLDLQVNGWKQLDKMSTSAASHAFGVAFINWRWQLSNVAGAILEESTEFLNCWVENLYIRSSINRALLATLGVNRSKSSPPHFQPFKELFVSFEFLFFECWVYIPVRENTVRYLDVFKNWIEWSIIISCIFS